MIATQTAIRRARLATQVVGAFTCDYIDEDFSSFAPMATQPHQIRAEDVPLIPVPDDISGYELVNGQLVPVMGSTIRHSWLAGELAAILRDHVRSVKVGAVFPDVWCKMPVPRDRERLHAPDISYFTNEKIEAEQADGIFHSPPDLAVEIHSPTNVRKPGDFQRRIRDYLEAGVRLLWVIYPDAGYAMVHRPDGSARMVRETEALDGEDVLPGFRLQLAELFEGQPKGDE
jgi:Uma2 family endonuclease